MPAFKFRLQTVLDMRAREEEARGRELALALRALEAEQTKLTELRVLEANALAEYHQLQKEGRLDVQAIQWFQTYSMGLMATIREQIRHIADAERIVEQRRAVLIEAARAKQVLDELKIQAQREHQRAEDLAEAKQLDEIATLRHVRKS
ncbi:flagellar biosynthesis chaperone [compost metagenome]